MQACKDIVNLFAGKAKSRSMLINQTVNTQQLNDVGLVDSTLASASPYYDVPTGGSKKNDYLSHIVIFTSVLFIVCFNIQI